MGGHPFALPAGRGADPQQLGFERLRNDAEESEAHGLPVRSLGQPGAGSRDLPKAGKRAGRPGFRESRELERSELDNIRRRCGSDAESAGRRSQTWGFRGVKARR